MRLRPLRLIAAALTFAVASVTGADETLKVGDRVRVDVPKVSNRRFEGVLTALNERTLTIVSTVDHSSREFPRSLIDTLEVARGKRTRWKGGAILGAVWGVGVGLMASNPQASTRFGANAGLIAAGIATCGAVGALAGSLLKTYRWTKVPEDNLALGIHPTQGGGLAFSARFSF